jgi:hypothetical protein
MIVGRESGLASAPDTLASKEGVASLLETVTLIPAGRPRRDEPTNRSQELFPGIIRADIRSYEAA